MGYIERLSDEIADLLVREGLGYNQTKAVFKIARRGFWPNAQKGVIQNYVSGISAMGRPASC